MITDYEVLQILDNCAALLKRAAWECQSPEYEEQSMLAEKTCEMIRDESSLLGYYDAISIH